jgi:hypothetical protein
MENVDRAFEARITAKLDQQQATIESLHIQGLGILLAISLIGIGIALIGRELGT